MSEKVPEFFVVLGPDHAGKSTALEFISASHACHVITPDCGRHTSERALISRLRQDIISEVGAALGITYSADFLTALSQAIVVHMRDQIMRPENDGPVLVDSYYYKILAKCRLAGADGHPMFTWWRTFPQPRRVFYLDIEPRAAWDRAGQGAGIHGLECDGGKVDEAAFNRYQRDLGKLMRDEISHLPVTVIDQRSSVSQTTQAIMEVIADERG
ncbi:hypothetical protein ACIRQQ_21680 [Streptomyces fuscichromogenes]|uniref:hypothetical protein n=1 Tax=Streptomyces fuscichromogenes TaxID=1324013 RepID=UPI0038274BFC